MFVNNGQLGRKYLSPERLRTAGMYTCQLIQKWSSATPPIPNACLLSDISYTGSAGTAVDTHREELPADSPSAASMLHKLSRPKTVRHALVQPNVRTTSPSPLLRPDSLSTHESGSDTSCTPSQIHKVAAHTPAASSPSSWKTRQGEGAGQKSIEMKGDRYT